MATAKYYNAIRAAQQHDAQHPVEGLPLFDFNDLAGKSFVARWIGRAIELLIPLLLYVARRFFPVFKFNGFYWITRHADVVAALERPDVFGVPYGLEMFELSTGPSGSAHFVLGLDGPAQQRQNAIIRRIVLKEDLPQINSWSRDFAQSLIEGGAGRIDAVTDFSIRIPTEICRRYFGLSFADPVRFGEWAIAISAFLFADPTGDPVKRRLGLAGAARLRRIIDAAIARAGGSSTKEPPAFTDMTLVERLVSLAPEFEIKHAEIRAIILGLIVGFIPTNGLAAAKMLELILSQDEAFRAACTAAKDSDSAAMQRIVAEAGRLNPALAPGQWRYTNAAVDIGGTHIPAGSTVMVSTMSAMRDARVYRAPKRFDPDAGNDSALVFGHGVHACLGQHVAMAIIGEMFLCLFATPELRPASDKFGRMQRIGYFPQRLDLEYRSTAATQTMIVAALPIAPDTDMERLRQHLAALGNPALPEVRASLDATGIVHFASATLIVGGERSPAPGLPVAPQHFLIIEFNVDGEREAALERIEAKCSFWLHPLLAAASPGDERSPLNLLAAHCLDLHFKPWGATGLNFFGTGDFPVAAIEKQSRLRAAVIEQLAIFLGARDEPQTGLENRAMLALGAVRRALRTEPEFSDLDAFTVQPMRRDLPLSRWRKPKSFFAPLADVVRGAFGMQLVAVLGGSLMLFMLATDYALSRNAGMSFEAMLLRVANWWDALRQLRVAHVLEPLPYLGTLFTLALVMTVLFWGLIGWVSFRALRHVEDIDVPDNRAASIDNLRAIVALENPPAYLQNHITAVTPLKPGLVRRLTLAFALWGIRQSLYWFRPGFVVTMGTIHYAKWFRLPGTDQLIFQSNYDGSWESYLEDFITRAHQGQTAAWSNGVGFPRTRGLIGEGADDGDRFKRWVRRQQVPTNFWYSRFPELTTELIRNAALIHDGLARAQTDTAARAWLDLIGSAQRQPYEIESAEIQGIVFRSLKRALYTACLPVRLPRTLAGRSEWLTVLRDGIEVGDSSPARLSFGKFPLGDRAMYIALSPSGLDRIGREGDVTRTRLPILDAFPSAFAMGMANRGRILGDLAAENSPEGWRWRDTSVPDVDDARTVEAMLIIYAPTSVDLDAAVALQRESLKSCGGETIGPAIRTVTLGDPKGTIQTDPNHRESYEHFGFRDGITTPVIRGTEQFTPYHAPRDVVEPGEFILGYRNNQGYFAPSIIVDAVSDRGENLPIAADAVPFGFADFRGADEQFSSRDFGRNGTFIVLRQVEQNVSGFKNFTADQAATLNAHYGRDQLAHTVGDTVTADWVAAKMMGRWRDGRPMVGNPTYANLFGDRRPNNDFAYGRDDPRGHGCPLGAHIRRANPRDSREPDDLLEQLITNRHRLLRRGRAYFYDAANGSYPVTDPPPTSERGLVFVAICADLERQFELVQQSWLGLPSFHGLDNEPDPIGSTAQPEQERRFTIPTPSGPLLLRDMQSFVKVRAGGYFFLPSRSAINYLIDLASHSSVERLFAPPA